MGLIIMQVTTIYVNFREKRLLMAESMNGSSSGDKDEDDESTNNLKRMEGSRSKRLGINQ